MLSLSYKCIKTNMYIKKMVTKNLFLLPVLKRLNLKQRKTHKENENIMNSTRLNFVLHELICKLYYVHNPYV